MLLHAAEAIGRWPAVFNLVLIVLLPKSDGGLNASNARVWFGTRDDWIGRSDGPTKEIGDFDSDGVFAVLSTPTNSGTETGKTLRVMSGVLLRVRAMQLL